MLLCIDIGNTTIGVGIFRDPLKGRGFSLSKIPTHPVRTAQEYREILAGIIAAKRTAKGDEPEAIISSVVPSATAPVKEALRGLCGREPLILDHRSPCGLTLAVKNPELIGPDRLANAAAGYHRAGGAVAVADFGTATTVTIVDRKGGFRGGSITPGIGLMYETLHARAARLPLLPVKKPRRFVGGDTASDMASGIILGTAGAVDCLIQGMEKELGFRLQLVLTGGYSGLMSSLAASGKDLPLKRLKDCAVVPHLTFEGLRIIYLNYIL